MRILSTVDWYLPGYKGGGPIRSLSNMVAALSDGVTRFYVLTSDRDHKDTKPYSNVPIDSWTPVGKAQVFYASSCSLGSFRRRILEVQPDILHLNSFFSPTTIKILFLRWLRLLPDAAIILAPRGEFSPGALQLKHIKKKLFMRFAGLFTGLYRNILWQASSPREKEDIESVFSRYSFAKEASIGVASPIHVSALLERVSGGLSTGKCLEKHPGRVSFVFISRVSPKKNLKLAIKMVSQLKGDVSFDIYGPVDDLSYWERCKSEIAKAPRNVLIRYRGPLPHQQACGKFAEYHFFLFPTFGESFGHAVIEALGAGCPVLISDQTPWTDLEASSVGWDLSLKDEARWIQKLQDCVDMDATAYHEMSRCASTFADGWIHTPTQGDNRSLLKESLCHHRALSQPVKSELASKLRKTNWWDISKGRIVFDCLGLMVGEQRGAERFICSIIGELASWGNRNYLLLINKSSLKFVKTLLPPPDYALLPVSGKNRIWRMLVQTLMGPIIARLVQAPLYVSSSVFPTIGFPCPTAAVVHDLLLYQFPQTYSRPEWLFRMALLNASVPRLKGIFTVSKASAEDIRAHFPAARCSIHVVPNGACARIAPSLSEARENAVLEELELANRRFVLSPLGGGPHKNPKILVDVALQLRQKGHGDVDIVVAGDAIQSLRNIPHPGSLRALGYVSDEVLSVLYARANALVYPTLFEGFGIPIIEAQAAGLPIICSDIPVLRAASGEAALFVDPCSPESITNAIIALLESPELQEGLRRRGLENAARFTWRHAAEEFVEACDAVMGHEPVRESVATSA